MIDIITKTRLLVKISFSIQHKTHDNKHFLRLNNQMRVTKQPLPICEVHILSGAFYRMEAIFYTIKKLIHSFTEYISLKAVISY